MIWRWIIEEDRKGKRTARRLTLVKTTPPFAKNYRLLKMTPPLAKNYSWPKITPPLAKNDTTVWQKWHHCLTKMTQLFAKNYCWLKITVCQKWWQPADEEQSWVRLRFGLWVNARVKDDVNVNGNTKCYQSQKHTIKRQQLKTWGNVLLCQNSSLFTRCLYYQIWGLKSFFLSLVKGERFIRFVQRTWGDVKFWMGLC